VALETGLTRTVRVGDREVPRIGLGTNRLTRSPEHVDFVRRAVEAGIGLIDTAHLYTGGQSEATIGEALDAGSASVLVATKGGYQPGEGRPEVLRAQVEESLRRLRTSTIELYYLHRVDPQTPLEDSLGAIRELMERGAIRHVGLSQVGVDVIERARNVVPIAAVQNHYNLRERGDDGVVDHCTREGIVFVPFFPLGGIHGGAVARLARERGISPTQVALAWLLKRSPAILPIPGSLSLAHVRENVAALDLGLTDEEFETLASAA
jgi:pyridoxine 4-dehydrogenase